MHHQVMEYLYNNYISFLLLECPILRDCKAWFELGMERSGIYPVNPDNNVPFQVW